MFKTINGGKLPTKGSKYSAAVDVYANEDVVIGAGKTKLISLGIAIDEDLIKKASDRDFENKANKPIDELIGCLGDGDEDVLYFDSFKRSHYLQLMLRSSLGAKGLILPNGVGIIDMDYRDEIKMIVHNPIQVYDANGVYRGNEEYVADYSIIDNSYEIKKGDRIGQIVLLEHQSYLFGIESKEERTGGFGSTGSR